MPRTKLDRFSETPESYRRNVNRVVKIAMARSDIGTKMELAEKMNLTRNQINRCFRSGFWDHELKQLNQILKFTEAERDQIWG